MFDWVPWAFSLLLLGSMAFLATIAFRGGQERGQHIDWEARARAREAMRASSREQAMETVYRVVYAVLAFGVLAAAAAMLIAWALTSGG